MKVCSQLQTLPSCPGIPNISPGHPWVPQLIQLAGLKGHFTFCPPSTIYTCVSMSESMQGFPPSTKQPESMTNPTSRTSSPQAPPLKDQILL